MNGIFPAQVDFFLVRNLPQIHRTNFSFDDFSLQENGRDVIVIFPSCNWRTVHFDYPYIRGSWKTTTGHHSTPQASPPPPQETLGISFILERKFTVFLCFTFYLRAISKYNPPGGLIFGGAISNGGGFFCVKSLGGLYLEGLIHGGAYFRIFTVCILFCDILCSCVFLEDLD